MMVLRLPVMNTTITPNEPQPEPDSTQTLWRLSWGGAGDAAHPSIRRMSLALAITVAAMLVAAEIGALLTVFGLGAGVLAICVLLMIGGTLLWRQAMLPLALVTAALALPAAMVAFGEQRIDRSAGLLTVRPTATADLGDGVIRRGAGSVFVDLRSMTATPGQVIKLSARSDTGRVVVALPRDRCYHLNVRSRMLRGTLVGRRSLQIAGLFREASGPFVAEMFSAPDRDVEWSDNNALVAFGRSVEPGRTEVTWTRRSQDPSAPTLVLDLQGAAGAVIRDYPSSVGPLQPTVGEQTGSAAWPFEVVLPLDPGSRAWDDRWQGPWTKAQRARGLPQRWSAWERDVIVAAKAQAIRAAGACARREDLADTWSKASYDADGTPRIIAVNGLGTVARWEWSPEGQLVRSTATVQDGAGR